MTSLDTSALTVHRPGDPEFEAGTSLFNAAIEHRPEAVVRARSTAEVSAALRYARDHDLDVTVRGGGHGVAGLATAGRLVIDLGLMRGVRVDPDTRTVDAEAGCTWIDVDTATQQHGLATPGGRVTHTGIAGLTLGGGQGWLSPKHGLTCDNLLEAQVVTADGTIVTASETEHQGLLWALRGGGPCPGVVTRFRYALHPVGPELVGGLVLHRLDEVHPVMDSYQRLVREAGPDFGGAVVFATAPPAPFIPPDLVGSQVLATTLAWFGGPDRPRAFDDFRSGHSPIVDLVGPMTYLELQALTDIANPRGMRNYWSAGYAHELEPPMVETLAQLSRARTSPHSAIVVTQMGAAVNAVPEEATAFPERSAQWLVHPLAMWPDAADDQREIGWVRRARTALAPFQSPGTYLNTDSAQGDQRRVAGVYGEEKAARLADLRSRYDPEGRFTTPASRLGAC